MSRGLRNHPLINEATRKKISRTALELGYQQNTFASNLRMKRSNTIGVVVPRLDSYFMSKVISGMEKVANLHGYNLIINQSDESSEKESACVRTMYNSRVDGMLISLAAETENLDHLHLIREKEIPLVFFDRTETQCSCSSVRIDNFKAGYEATKHLTDQGCRDILHIGGKLQSSVYRERFGGYKKALEEAGIPFKKEYLHTDNLRNTDTSSIVRLIRSGILKPDGIFASRDSCAVDLILRLKQQGYSIPGDIAVVGFNNDPVSQVVEPNLTTVEYLGAEIGEAAAGKLFDLIFGKIDGKDGELILPHHLLIRASSLRSQLIGEDHAKELVKTTDNHI